MPSSRSQQSGIDTMVAFAVGTGVEARAIPPVIGNNATDTATQTATIVRAIAMMNLAKEELCHREIQGQVTPS